MHFDNGKPKYLSSKVLVIFTVQNWVFKERRKKKVFGLGYYWLYLQCLSRWLASYNQ